MQKSIKRLFEKIRNGKNKLIKRPAMIACFLILVFDSIDFFSKCKENYSLADFAD